MATMGDESSLPPGKLFSDRVWWQFGGTHMCLSEIFTLEEKMQNKSVSTQILHEVIQDEKNLLYLAMLM